MKKIKHGFYLLVVLLLKCIIHPVWRAKILKIMGAKVGQNVRVNSINLFNLENGFRNLIINDDVYIGPECRFDLSNTIKIGRGAVLSSGTCILTHNDPGSYHNSPLCKVYPPTKQVVEIGEFAWIGINAVILAGSRVGDYTIVGALSLVRSYLEDSAVYAGIPAKKIRDINVSDK